MILAHIAVCGDLFDFSFDLPFDQFLPPALPLRFWIQVIVSFYFQYHFYVIINADKKIKAEWNIHI